MSNDISDQRGSGVANGDIEKNLSPETPDLPHEKPPAHPLMYNATKEDVLVDFDGPNDPYRPLNWSFRKKLTTTVLFGLTTCWVMFTSTIYSAAMYEIEEEFQVSTEVAALGITLMMFGLAFGPLVWGPLSEAYGRRWPILIPYFLTAVFTFGTAVAKDIQTVLITRFFVGFFGGAPVTNVGGALTDFWSPRWRGNAIVSYSVTLVAGPILGPVVGSAISTSYLSWRWTMYLAGIMLAAQFAIDFFLIDESYAPVLLAHKARRLRQEGGNWALHAEHEQFALSFQEISRKYLIRPIQILGTPIGFLMCLYTAFLFGILYANLEGFVIEFQQVRGWGLVESELPFISVLVGIFCAAAVNIYNNKLYGKAMTANGNKTVPEARLPPMMVGGISFTAGLFIFAWTSNRSISPWPSIIAVGLTGFGFNTILQASLNYLIDTFTKFGASAVAASTFMRCLFAGCFPLFINPLYHNLGVDWGTTVFACIAAAMIPVPFVFHVWGKRIRASSKWSRHAV